MASEARHDVNGAGVDGKQEVAGGLPAHPHTHTVSQVFHPSYKKPANPGPLGLIGFALTTFVLGLYQCGAGLPDSNPEGDVGPFQAVFGLAVFMGGIAQFVAGIMEYGVGNTLGTTIHCSYGAFWLSFAMFMIPSLGIQDAYKGDAHAFTYAIGIYLILWCFLTLIFLLAALRTNWTIVAVLVWLILAFFFLALAQFTATTHSTASIGLNKTGGACAIICAALAFWAGGAGLMVEETTMVRFPLGNIEGPQKVSEA